MAATNSTGNGSGRMNFYNVSYGKLSSRFKEVDESLTEITEKELKSLTQKVENIDLRNKYQEKGGEYPYTVYFDKIEGKINEIKKDVYDSGISLHIDMTDTDGDNSIVQIKFYSKYTENILNRLINVQSVDSEFCLTPYAIPSEFEADGKTIKVYNQGVSLKESGNKTEVAFRNDNSKLPATERVEDAEGKLQTSRVKRINFLFDEVSKKFSKSGNSNSEKPSPTKPSPTKPSPAETVEDDDLPF